MTFDINKIFGVSARIAFALCVACSLLLFIPSSILPFEIESVRKEYGMILYIVLVISISILFSYFVKILIEVLKKRIKKIKIWSGYKYIAKNFSDEEIEYLKNLYEKRQSAIMIDLKDPVAKKLQSFNVISPSAGYCVAHAGYTQGFVQPWVFELFDKHPKFLVKKHK